MTLVLVLLFMTVYVTVPLSPLKKTAGSNVTLVTKTLPVIGDMLWVRSAHTTPVRLQRRSARMRKFRTVLIYITPRLYVM